MLFESGQESNPLKRAVPAFFLFNMLTLGIIWVALDIVGQKKEIINSFLILIPIFSIVLFFVGSIAHNIFRVKYFVLIMGIFGVMPIFTACLSPFVAFLIIAKYSSFSKVVAACFYLFSLILSAFINARNLKLLEEKVGYLDRQINSRNSKYYFIDRKKMKEISFFMKKRSIFRICGEIIPGLLPIAVLGYPLQRLITDVGGHATTMAFLSIISVPLSLYMAGRIAGGYMLWVYLINCHEKKIGFPIFFLK